MEHAHTLAAPVLGRYRLVRRLGTGGFGTVWLAHDVRLDRPVAVKRVPTDGAEEAERARREALAAARLNHPGIVALYEAGTDEEACYLVSELVRGETLAALERDGALSDRDVVAIGMALCDALAHAHGRAVVHRDVKPGNVMVPDSAGDGAAAAKLTDFGIARVVGDDALTRTGDVVGTLAYMAPEQAEGRDPSPAFDVYSLALVLYEALTGANPIRGASPAETARRVGMRVPPLSRVRRDLPRDLCDAVDAALEPDPARRAPLGELHDGLAGALDEVGDEPGIVAESGPTTLTRPWRRDTAPRLSPQPPPREAGRPERVPWEEGPGRRAPEREPWEAEPAAEPLPAARGSGLVSRAAAAAGTGALVAAALGWLSPVVPPVTPMAAGAGVAIAVLLLPRLGWLAAAALVEGWLAARGSPGTALVLAPAIIAVPPLLLRAKTAWSLPAAAPLLGLAGLAVAYPALAGQARTPIRRAALGALGSLWLALGEPVAGQRLLAGPPPGLPARAAWEPSVSLAARDVLGTVLDVRVLAVAAAFAVAAVVLPWIVHGRRAGPDALAAAVWAVALAAAIRAAVAPVDPRGLALGAVVAAVAAVAARAVRLPAR